MNQNLADTYPRTDHITTEDYRQVYMMLDASNFSGVAHSLEEYKQKVWLEARAAGKGSDWVARHPIMVCFVEKLCQLSGNWQGNPSPVMDAVELVHLYSQQEVL